MIERVSANTKAILLLTAPLLVGRPRDQLDLVSQGEYQRLRFRLAELGRQPADLLGTGAEPLVEDLADLIAPARMRSLLARGFLLAQAIERWHSRGIWVLSRADADYPKRLKDRLKDDAPPVLYGCGERSLLNRGGLAVVGSRAADQELLEYAAGAGTLAGRAGMSVVSGGARGIDRAAMGGTLDAGGHVVGVLGDSLESAALSRESRQSLLDGRLVFISPFDPLAPFLTGHAMQRNKVVYALADAALVVNADKGKGGTWAGAVEQLKKYSFVPVFVRANGTASDALRALEAMGARAWPEPRTQDELRSVVASPTVATLTRDAYLFDSTVVPSPRGLPATAAALPSPDQMLFGTARALILRLLETPKSEKEVMAKLGIVKAQAAVWLEQLVAEGEISKQGKPTKYAVSKRVEGVPSVTPSVDNARRKRAAK